MDIGIDARELCGKPTGVGRYLASLMAAWDCLPDAAGHRFLLYRPAGADLSTDCGCPGCRWRNGWSPPARAGQGAPPSPSGLRRPGTSGTAGTIWEQLHLARALRRDRPDVLFSPAYTAPLATSVPVVLTVHDLSFVAHPEWFPLRMRWRQRLLTTLAARRARRVLTDSEFSRGEIVARLGVPAARVSVVPLGLTGPPGRARQGSPAAHDPMVLFVGSIFNRRHLPELIRAVASVSARHPGLRLEIVGDNRTYPHQDLTALSREAGLGSNVGIRSYVSDEVLADLYARAGLFVFLSDYEGFGLTPLEALASGVPVLVGDTPVAREVYGDAAQFVGTTDEAAIAAGIERLLFEPGVSEYPLVEGARRPATVLLGERRTTDARGAARRPAGGARMTDLAIVIVSYNVRADLARALQSLSEAPPAIPHEVIVVDNASSDGSLQMVRERWPGVRTIDAGANLGFSKANNLALRATSGEWVLLLNSDTVVPPGAIDALVGHLRSHPEAAVAGPRLVDAEGRPEISFGRDDRAAQRGSAEAAGPALRPGLASRSTPGGRGPEEREGGGLGQRRLPAGPPR